MAARLSVSLFVCLLFAASEVVAQDATPASSPTSASTSTSTSLPTLTETVPTLSVTTPNTDELRWKKAKKIGWAGTLAHVVLLPTSATMFFYAGISNSEVGVGTSVVVGLSSFVLPSIGEMYYRKRALPIIKYTLYRGALLGATISAGIQLEEFFNLDEKMVFLSASAYALGMLYLHKKEYESLHKSVQNTASLALPTTPRLQVNLLPTLLPNDDGTLSTGLGIVGSW